MNTKLLIIGLIVIIAISVSLTMVNQSNKSGISNLGIGGTKENSCTDTDDGWNVKTRGTVSGYYNGKSYSYDDICLTGTTLKEYYCSKGQYYSDTYNCLGDVTKKCLNGACV